VNLRKLTFVLLLLPILVGCDGFNIGNGMTKVAEARECYEAIKAVADIESAGEGFLSSGEPKILFEAHHFSRLTRHRYDYTHPNISSLTWNRALYKGGLAEHTRLAEAVLLDRTAALQSASWGKFQIMGFNAKRAGFKNVFHMVDEFETGEGKHLEGFVKYIKFTLLDDELKAKDWSGFARQYNGKLYYKNEYDKKLKEAYLKYLKA